MFHSFISLQGKSGHSQERGSGDVTEAAVHGGQQAGGSPGRPAGAAAQADHGCQEMIRYWSFKEGLLFFIVNNRVFFVTNMYFI